MNIFEQGPIRPPEEADSLLIRTTRGCPWNKCHFCTLFKDIHFTIRPMDEIKQDILLARQHYGNTRFKNCFLQDGDSFAMSTMDLLEVLRLLKQTFPNIQQISSYGRAQSMLKKSENEICEIHDAGLNMLYCGVESGSDKVLKKVRKGVSAESIIQSARKAKRAGMSLKVFVIIGLGGKELSDDHAKESAKVVNQINPEKIRLMSLAVKNQTELANMVNDGSFTLLSEIEMISEQKRFLQDLDNIQCHYGNYHAINLLNEVAGVLPDKKDKLLATIDSFLSLSREAQINYILGKRMRHYDRLSDLNNSTHFETIQQHLDFFRKQGDSSLETLFHDLRKQTIYNRTKPQ